MNAHQLLVIIGWHFNKAKEYAHYQAREKNYHRRQEYGSQANYHSLKANTYADALNALCAPKKAVEAIAA